MDKQSKLTFVALTGLTVAILLLKGRGHPSVTASSETPQSEFEAPYQYATPGIPDDSVSLNGGAPFQSTVNVSVNPSYLGTLSQSYIPMFGFVGIGAPVAQPAQQSTQAAAQPAQLVAPPPAPATFVHTPPIYDGTRVTTSDGYAIIGGRFADNTIGSVFAGANAPVPGHSYLYHL